MRKIFALLTVFVFAFSFAYGEDYIRRTESGYSLVPVLNNVYLRLDGSNSSSTTDNFNFFQNLVIAGGVDGKALSVYRNADYIKTYVDQYGFGNLYTNSAMTLNANDGSSNLYTYFSNLDFNIYGATANPTIREWGFNTAAGVKKYVQTQLTAAGVYELTRQDANVTKMSIGMPLDLLTNSITTTGTLGAGAGTLTSLSLTTDLSVANGGTGRSSFSDQMPICGGNPDTGALQTVVVGTAYYPLCYNASGVMPSFQVLAVGGGGTGRTNDTAYALIAGGATTTAAHTSIANNAVSYKPLLSAGTSAYPAWATVIYPSALTINQVLYGSAANTIGSSANLTFDGTVLTATKLVVDTTTLVVDAVGYESRIGIGTATPAALLHLAGIDSSAYGQIDTGLNFDFVDIPPEPTPTLIATDVGNVDAGKHYYYVAYYTALGNTGIANVLRNNVTTDPTHKQVSVAIPVSTDYRVVGRKIYRTKAGGADYEEYLLDTITNNVDVTYIDNLSDASMGVTRAYAYTIPNTTNSVILSNGTTAMVLDYKATVFGAGAKVSSLGVVIGGYAGKDMGAQAVNNVLLGYQTGYIITTGSNNIFIGTYAGKAGVVAASRNVSIGDYAGYTAAAYSGINIGYRAGMYAGGNYNTIVGAQAGYGVAGYTAIINNCLFGAFAGTALKSPGGSNNILIGYESGDNITTGSSNIIIGYSLAGSSATVSSELNIGGVLKGSLVAGSEYLQFPFCKPFYFGTDTAVYVWSSADGWFNLVADTGVEVNAPILNISALYCAGAIDAPSLPTGTLAAPPAGLGAGDFWTDTTDSATNAIVRCHI